jgi:hypothetical protein
MVAEREVGIDCIQFADRHRRTIHGLFRTVRGAIADRVSTLGHLAGLLLYTWVYPEHAHQLRLPPKRTDAKAIEELIAQLEQYRFDPSANRVSPSGPLPDQVHVSGFSATHHGAVLFASPLTVAFPLSDLWCRGGFEIGFVYPVRYTAQSIWEELAQAVIQHDKPEIDQLVVSVGAPDRGGLIFPGDEVVFRFMLDSAPRPRIELKNVKRVIAHSWATGRIEQLYPERLVLSPGYSPGLLPSHHPLSAHTLAQQSGQPPNPDASAKPSSRA